MKVERGTGVRKMGMLARRMLQGAVLVAVAASIAPAFGAGRGGIQISNVAAGTAALTQMGSVTTITTGSRNTIINFQALSVGSGETLNFVQPTTSSRVLNRISGAEPTTIDGTVWSNGAVYFVNPAGVIFGNGAVVNVANLYAAAGNISDADFLAGNNAFTGNTGAVQNSGLIRAQEVHLVGGTVANFGQIYTTGDGADGIVTMTAGKDVYIGETNSPTGKAGVLVKVSSDTSSVKSGTGVTNTGTVDAGQGTLRMGAGDVYAAGIYNSGSLKAARITLDSGANTNISTGTIDASNATGQGGSVEMVGNQVAVASGTVDASGATGGGSIKIGGDFHGAAGTPTAQETVIGPTAVIRADALTSGNGGQVAVWSDVETQFYGQISANGAGNGNGGYVETSGKIDLQATGNVSAIGGPGGLPGTWLMDPRNITVTGSADDHVSSSSSAGTVTFITDSSTPSGEDANVKASSITAALNGGTSVVLNTHPGSETSANGDITVSSAINKTTGGTATLTLNADNDINVNAGISSTSNALNITLNAGGAITTSAAGPLTSNGGNIALNAAGNITIGVAVTSKGGTIQLNAGDTGGTGVISTGSHTLDSSNGGGTDGDIILQASDVQVDNANFNAGTTGTIFFETNTGTEAIHVIPEPGTLGTDVSGAYNIDKSELDAALGGATKVVIGQAGVQSGDISVDNPYTFNPNGEASLRMNTSGNLSIGANLAPQSANDGLNLTLAGGNVSVAAAVTVDLAGGSATGTFFSGGGSFTNIGTIKDASEINILQSGAVSIQGPLNAGTGVVRISGSTIGESGGGAITAGSLAIQATDDVSLTSGIAVSSLGAASNGHAITVTTTGALNLNTVPASGSVPSGLTGVVQLTGIESNGGVVNITAGGNFTISNPADSGAADMTLATSAGNLVGSGSNAVSGKDIALNAAGGIGIGTALTVAPTGNLTLTTAGLNAAGNISLNTGPLSISKIAGITTDDTGTGQTVAFNATGAVTIDAALAMGAHQTLSITASGNINGDGVATDALSGPQINLSAAGIGGTNPVSVNPTVGATFTTTGASGAGDITLTSTAALSLFTFVTDVGTPQVVQIENSGDLVVGANVSVASGDVLLLHAGTSGTGILSFTGTPTLKADDIILQSGIGDGSASAATVDVSGGVTLANAAGSGAPASVTIEQDASITDEPLTTANYQGGVLPANLGLQSDGGNVTIATAANFGGAALTLSAPKAGSSINLNVAISGGNEPLGLTMNAPTINVSANVGTTNDQAYNGGVVIQQDVTLSGRNIGFGGGVDSASGDFRNLTLTSTGIIGFAGDLGGTAGGGTEFGSVVVTTGTTELGNTAPFTLVTKQTGGSSGQVSFGGPVIVNGPTTIQTTATTALGSLTAGMDDVTFASTVDSTASAHNSLEVDSPGVTRFEGNVGSAANGELGGVTINSGGAQGGALEQTQLGNGGNFSMTVGSPIVFNDPVVLMANTTLTTANNGPVTFKSTVDSETGDGFTLNVQAPGGEVSFAGNIGATVANGQLGGLTVNSASVSLGSSGTLDIDTTGAGATGGAISLDEPITLGANLDITVSNGSAVAGDPYVTLGQLTGSVVNMTVDSPGIIAFDGGVGAGVTSIFTLGGGTTQFGSGGAITVTTAGAQTYDEAVTLVGDTTFKGSSLQFNGSPVSINAGTFNLTLASDSMAFGGGANSVQGTGNLTIEAAADTDAIVVGTAGAAPSTLFISRPTIAAIQDGFASITIGSATESGVVTVSSDDPGFAPVTFTDPVTIQSPGVGGSIVVNGGAAATIPAIYGDGNAAITLTAPAITLNASVMTNGNNITVNGAVSLGSATEIYLKSYGAPGNDLFNAGNQAGNITVVGNINDTGTPSELILAAFGALTLGNIDVQGAVGNTAAPMGLVMLGSDVKIHGDLRTTNSGSAGGELVIEGNSVTMAGNANPATPTAITIDTDASGGTANAGPVTIMAPIDHLAGSGPVSLTIDTSATNGHAGQDITLESVGGSQSLAGLTLIAGTGNVSVADVTVTGAFSSSGVNFSNSGVISAAGVTVNHTGAVSIDAGISSGSAAVSLTGDTIQIAMTSAPVNGLTVTMSDVGGVTIGSTITGTNGVTSTSTGSGTFTLNGGAGISTTDSDVTITHAGGLVTIDEPISAGAGAGAGNVSITGLGITGNGAGTIGGKGITLAGGTGDVTLNAVVTAAGLFTSSGAAFTNNAGVNSDGVSMTQTGLVSVNAPLNSTGFVVSISGAGITSAVGATIGGSAITLTGGSGNVSLGDVVTGTGLVSVSGVGFSNTATVTGDGITLNMTGSVTADGALTGGAGAVNISGTTFGNSATVSGAGIKLTQSGLATLNGNLDAGGGLVTISAAGVTQSSGIINGSALVLEGTGTFALPDANTVGTLAANVTGGLTFDSAGPLTVGAAGSPTVTGIATGGGNLDLTPGGGLTVSDAINTGAGLLALNGSTISDPSSALTGGAITITATTTATVGGAINGTGAVNIGGTAVSATGGITGTSANLTASAGNLTAGSITTTTGDIVLSATGTTSLSGTFNSAGKFTAGPVTTTAATTITSAGAAGITLGNVSGNGTLTVTANGAGGITMGALALPGNTTLTAAGAPGITAGDVTGDSNITFNTTDAGAKISVGELGTGTGDRVGAVTFNSSDVVQLNGNIFAASALFAGPGGGALADVPKAATIFADTAAFASHELQIDVSETFKMTSGEKLTVHDSSGASGTIGSLDIEAGHGVQVGDLSVLGDLTINSGNANNKITLEERHPAADFAAPGGGNISPDFGTDIVVGGNITLTGQVGIDPASGGPQQSVRIESANAASFTGGSPPTGVSFVNASKILFFGPPSPGNVSEDHMVVATGPNAGTVVDLVANGTDGNNPSELQGSVIPRDVQTLAPQQDQAISGALLDALTQIGIYARDVSVDEITEYLLRRALYQDVPLKLNPDLPDNTVAVNRLPFSPVLPVVDAYRALFFAPELDKDGKQVMENGKPKLKAQDDAIQQAIGQSWQAYKQDKGDDATPKGFRGYLEAHEKDQANFAAALSDLNQLRDLLKQIQGLGLTDQEFEGSEKVLFTKVRPANIREEDFPDIVNGPSSRGQGVAAK